MPKRRTKAQEEAFQHVKNCLKHRTAPYSESISKNECLPELEVPEDIIERDDLRSLIEMTTSRKMNPYSSSDITEDDLNSVLNTLRYDTRKVLERFYMLKPQAVKIEINERDGLNQYNHITDYYIVSPNRGRANIKCTVNYSRDGTPKTITAHSLDELTFLLQLEFDMLIYDKSEDRPYEAVRHILYNHLKRIDMGLSCQYQLDIDYPRDFLERTEGIDEFENENGKVLKKVQSILSYVLKEAELRYPNDEMARSFVLSDDIECIFKSNITDRFYTLFGGKITFKKDVNGSYAYICSTIQYSGDGYPKEIISDSFIDFNKQIDNEYDLLIKNYADNGHAREKAIADILRTLYQTDKCDKSYCHELIIPDDFTDFLDCRTEYSFDTKKKETIPNRIWYFGKEPYIYGDSEDAILSEGEIKNKLEEINNYIKNESSTYRMLKPGNVTLLKNPDVKYTIFSCTIQYSCDGSPKIITADNEEDLFIYMDIEFEMLFHYKTNWSETKEIFTKEELEDIKEIESAAEEKEKAQLFVLKKMKNRRNILGKIYAYNKLIISDSLVNCIEYKGTFYTSYKEEKEHDSNLKKEWQLGKINWFSYNVNEETEEEIEDSKLVSLFSLQCDVRNILSNYFMLKPGDVTLKTDKEGKHIHICCPIEYSRNGSQDKITAETLSELASHLELELALLMEDSYEYLNLKICSQDVIKAVSSAIPLSPIEPVLDEIADFRYFNEFIDVCKNYNTLISGNKIEREYLRSQLVAKKNEKSFIQERDRLFDRNIDASPDIEYFYSMIKIKMDVEKIYSSAEKLSKLIGYSPAQFSKVRGKTKVPKKEFALRLGIAFHLPIDELKKFIASAGYIFPYDKKDWLILECIQRGITDYKDIVSKLFDISQKLSEIYEMIKEKDPELEGLLTNDPYLDVLFSGNDELNKKIQQLLEKKQEFRGYTVLKKHIKDYLKLKLEI